MVFGRRAEKICVRPAAPGVDQILADLEAAGPQDPVFALSTDLLNDWLETTSTGNDISDPNVLYNKVTEYINSKSKLEVLEKEVVQGTQSLEKSLLDLKELAKEVQANLEKAKNPNKDFKPTTNSVSEEKEVNSESDKQIEESSNCSDQENLC